MVILVFLGPLRGHADNGLLYKEYKWFISQQLQCGSQIKQCPNGRCSIDCVSSSTVWSPAKLIEMSDGEKCAAQPFLIHIHPMKESMKC